MHRMEMKTESRPPNGKGMRRLLFLVVGVLALASLPAMAQEPDARAIVEASVKYYRGDASEATVAMTIHRPTWERTLVIRAWTKGQKESLFHIIAPPKDEGNGTLKKGQEMWTYNPKVNRVIKLPPSMMSQSWMGSDFSNNDLAKSDSILDDYTHTIQGVKEENGHKVYIIDSVPKPGAPVIWGKQRLFIREDHILLREEFYDEDGRLVKAMTGRQIEMLGGKLFPRFWRMQKADAPGEYTELDYRKLEFKKDLPDRLFTLAALRNPPRR
ncbi:MAG: outer membrane lipoprotein-sorting protein [Deltaproteobacteria bacterium]|jgi:outer membrane lipoprotein-sorting protein